MDAFRTQGININPITEVLMKHGQDRRARAAKQQQQEQEKLNKSEAMYLSAMLRAGDDIEKRNAFIQDGYSKGLFDDDDLELFSTERADNLDAMIVDKMKIDGYDSLIPQKGEGYTLGQGQTRFDSQNRPVAEGSKKPATLKEIDTGNEIQLVNNAGETVRTIQKTGNEKADKKLIEKGKLQFDRTNKLREQVKKVDPDFTKVNDAYTRIKASAQDPSPAGDLALIFNYMKMLDPGSTVREGEFATASNAAGVDTRVANAYNRVIEGTRLSEPQRKDFLGRSEMLFDAADKNFTKRTKGISKQANNFNIPLDEIGLGRFMPEDPMKAQAEESAKAPPNALEFLRNNPNQIGAFEQKYGYRPEGY